jgi:hypothetical protein
VRPTDEVNSLINCLTNNEDVRQDLWVCYLSGAPIESLENRLERIKFEYSDDIELRKAIWQLIHNPISEELSQMLKDNFTDYERTIICYLMLGMDASKISVVKGISEVRIRQSIATIRYNKIWEVMYGAKEKSDRRRTVRS